MIVAIGKDEKPDSKELQDTKSWLELKGVDLDITATLTGTRKENTDKLRKWFKTRKRS